MADFERTAADSVDTLDTVRAPGVIVRSASDALVAPDSAECITWPRIALRVSDAAAATDTAASASSLHRFKNDAWAYIYEYPLKVATDYVRSASDTVGTADAAATLRWRGGLPADTIEATDAAERVTDTVRRLSDTCAAADGATGLLGRDRTRDPAPDSISVSDTLVVEKLKQSDVSDTVDVTDSLTALKSQRGDAQDSVSLTDAVGRVHEAERAIEETVDAAEDLVADKHVGSSVAETAIDVTDAVSRIADTNRLIHESVFNTDRSVRSTSSLRPEADTVSVSDAAQVSKTLGRGAADSITIGAESAQTVGLQARHIVETVEVREYLTWQHSWGPNWSFEIPGAHPGNAENWFTSPSTDGTGQDLRGGSEDVANFDEGATDHEAEDFITGWVVTEWLELLDANYQSGELEAFDSGWGFDLGRLDFDEDDLIDLGVETLETLWSNAAVQVLDESADGVDDGFTTGWAVTAKYVPDAVTGAVFTGGATAETFDTWTTPLRW